MVAQDARQPEHILCFMGEAISQQKSRVRRVLRFARHGIDAVRSIMSAFEGFVFSVCLVVALIVVAVMVMVVTESFADQPSGVTRTVLHVRAETCDEAVAISPVVLATRDGKLNSSSSIHGLDLSSCDESDGSSHAVLVADQGVAKRHQITHLVIDRHDPERAVLITSSQVRRVDYDHMWIGTLDLTAAPPIHLPPLATPELAAMLEDRQSCPHRDQVQLIYRDCGTDWERADLRTFEALP